MTAIIAYFVDGPWHGTHAELPSAEPDWRIARPAGNHGRRFTSEGSPDLYVTIECGVYKRSAEPVCYSPRVQVWRYNWGGWQ